MRARLSSPTSLKHLSYFATTSTPRTDTHISSKSFFVSTTLTTPTFLGLQTPQAESKPNYSTQKAILFHKDRKPSASNLATMPTCSHMGLGSIGLSHTGASPSWLTPRTSMRSWSEEEGGSSRLRPQEHTLCVFVFAVCPGLALSSMQIFDSQSCFLTCHQPKSKSPNNPRSLASRDTATPISRPVFMIFRSFNINPVIDVRPR